MPGLTRSVFEPLSVGTRTSAPRSASGMVIGTSTSRFPPLRVNTGEGPTCVIRYRSPGGPPSRPGSPLPAMRTRLPSRTPAGTFTRRRLTVRTAPAPWQVGHGSSITVPEPPQREQGCEIENMPCPCVSMPRPSQRGHTIGVVPGLAPVPRQVGQVACMGTCSGTCAPEMAWSKVIETCASRSAPRSARGRARPPRRAPPAPPNRLERMSPIELPSKSKLPKPPKPPPGPAPVANGPLPESYCLRFSGSPSTS